MLVLEQNDGEEVPVKANLRDCKLKCIITEKEKKFETFGQICNLELEISENSQIFLRSALNLHTNPKESGMTVLLIYDFFI